MITKDNILTLLAKSYRARKGYHLDVTFQFTQPGVPDFSVSGTLDVHYPGDLLFTTESKDGLVTAARTDPKGFTRFNFPKSEAMMTPMPPSRSRIAKCLTSTSMFDDGLADILAGFTPYGGDITLIRDIAPASINGVSCNGYIVDVASRTPMPTSVTVFVSKSGQDLHRFVTDHPTIKGAQRTVTLSAPKPIVALPRNPKVTDKDMLKLTAEPEFGGAVVIGKVAPPLVGTTLKGQSFDLDNPTSAKATIVHFWSIFDRNSCQQVIDISHAIAPFPKGSVQVVSVCLDHVESSQRVKALWTRMGASWSTIIDPLGPDSDAARTWKTDTPGGLVILSKSSRVQGVALRSTDITDAVMAAMRSR
jgi:hypothetical protein